MENKTQENNFIENFAIYKSEDFIVLAMKDSRSSMIYTLDIYEAEKIAEKLIIEVEKVRNNKI